MTDQIYKAYRTWLASFERGRTIDVEQAFAAGYRAASVPPMIREAFANEKAKEAAEHALAAVSISATLTPAKLTPFEDSFIELMLDGMAEADRAIRKSPQPNYVISKIAEEAGEVVKAAIHCAEGRETAANVRAEMRQLIAMLYRLWAEGDQVHGLLAVYPITKDPDNAA